MEQIINLTVVYDNNHLQSGLQTDWGFSCLIEFNKSILLFDTGNNGTILLNNMKKLGIDPQSINVVFLSHFHHDHTGGLQKFLDVNSKVKVFYPQSFPKEIVEIIKHSGAERFPVSEYSEILPNIFTLGEIQGNIPEQSLVISMTNKLIVITGCAHPGILNILWKTKEHFHDELIYLVLGGFHLHKSTEEEINEVIQNMFNMNVLTVGPTHCSGSAARKMFKEVFEADYFEVGVGKKIEVK